MVNKLALFVVDRILISSTPQTPRLKIIFILAGIVMVQNLSAQQDSLSHHYSVAQSTIISQNHKFAAIEMEEYN
jgi:hypothetical protein